MNEIAYSKREVYLTNWWDIKYTYIRRLKQTAMPEIIKCWSWHSRWRLISYILCFTVRCIWIKLSEAFRRSLPDALWRPFQATKVFCYVTMLSVSRLYGVEGLINWSILNWKRLARSWLRSKLGTTLPRNLPVGTQKTTKILNHGTQCPG